MKLVPDSKKILLVSLSFWSQVAGLLVLIVPEVIYMKTGIDTNPQSLWAAGLLLLLTGLIGRFFTQDNATWVEWLRMTGIALVIALLCFVLPNTSSAHDVHSDPGASLDISVPLIARWEGLRTEAYLDIVGVPTICYGSTRGIRMGMSMTKAQCDRLLREEVLEYRDGWIDYVQPQARMNWLPPSREAAYTSLAYNVGIAGAGRSTATRRLNRGNIIGGCEAIGWWNKAGGRVVRGLVNRRSHETKLCLQ